MASDSDGQGIGCDNMTVVIVGLAGTAEALRSLCEREADVPLPSSLILRQESLSGAGSASSASGATLTANIRATTATASVTADGSGAGGAGIASYLASVASMASSRKADIVAAFRASMAEAHAEGDIIITTDEETEEQLEAQFEDADLT